MPKRSPISKMRRFEVFKRDGFICQYCGQRPPAVILEIDHIISVREGGKNDEPNLITSCFDCNRGKGATSLKVAPIDLKKRAKLMAERTAQSNAYEKLLREEHVCGVCWRKIKGD